MWSVQAASTGEIRTINFVKRGRKTFMTCVLFVKCIDTKITKVLDYRYYTRKLF